jgi:hypothetical protein
MKRIIFTIVLFTSLFADYSVGDQISTDHQNLLFDVCYPAVNSQLSLSDFVDGNTVIWINIAASW